MRDDFTQQTKEKLALRAGYTCSKPDCRVPTRGASSDEDGTINIGVAAHITAASSGGPRYNPKLSQEKRKHHSNGIWLCETHAKLIDSDEQHFTVDILRSWKREVEKNSFNALVSHQKSVEILKKTLAENADEDKMLSSLGLSDNEGLDETVNSIVESAKNDLTVCKRIPDWSENAIYLDLKITDEKETRVFDVSGLTRAIKAFGELLVISPPGTGKTTTLIQLTENILKAEHVAVYMPLNEWSVSSSHFFENLIKRSAFQNYKEQHFMLLAKYGRLTFVLDGWNELNEEAKEKARVEISFLRREYPTIRFVVGTRQKELDLPLDCQVVQINSLDENQQLDIARKKRGKEGERLLDHAWRTAGIRELVSIPLYLNALLANTSGNTLPTTKEEVLKAFVEEHEQKKETAAILRKEFHGFHRNLLTSIAVEATFNLSTVTPISQARASVKNVEEVLKEQKQINSFPEPTKAIDILVNQHLLIKGSNESSVLFQHQQFQEWFASFEVENLMLRALDGDVEALDKLKRNIVNVPSWEEPILFACERLSRSHDKGGDAISASVLEVMGIDPLLAAEMIYRASDDVWAEIKTKVINFVQQWHVQGTVDSAVRFMVTTGKEDFCSHLWPLFSSEDNQVHLPALRAGHKFRPSVLGVDYKKRISEISEEVRQNMLAEIVLDSGLEGIELATELALEDKSIKVKFSVVEALLFRRAERCALQIMNSGPDDLWNLLAQKGYACEIEDGKALARLKEEQDKVLAEKTNPCEKLRSILYQRSISSANSNEVESIIGAIDFSERGDEDHSLVYKAYENYPSETVSALVSHIENHRAVPFGSERYLLSSGMIIDDGPVSELVINPEEKKDLAKKAVGIVGPKTIIALIERLFLVSGELSEKDGYDKDLSDECHRLLCFVSGSNVNSFAKAFNYFSDETDIKKIDVLCEILGRYGAAGDRALIKFSHDDHENIVRILSRFGEILFEFSESTREQFGRVAQAIERLGSPSLVPLLEKLLVEDLARREKAIEARNKGQNVSNDAHMCWGLQYGRAFTAIGDDASSDVLRSFLSHERFGIDSACALRAIWRKTLPEKVENGFLRSHPDFSLIEENVKERSLVNENRQPLGFSEDIFKVVEEMIGEEDINKKKHALKLVSIAFSMPYSNKQELINELCNLPIYGEAKNALLTELALSGEKISSVAILSGVKDLIEEAKEKRWLLDEQNNWRINGWLRLFPFSENPKAIFDALVLLEDHYKNPWDFNDLLDAFGKAKSEEAVDVLCKLAEQDTRFMERYEWIDALTKSNKVSAACFLLNAICNGPMLALGDRMRWNINQKMAWLMEQLPEFRDKVYETYQELPTENQARGLISRSISEAPDMEGILLLVRGYARENKNFDQTNLLWAIRSALIEKRQSLDFPGTEELYSLPAQDLRRELFNLALNGNDQESNLAQGCLVAIEELREDYGDVEFELRHPDIESGRPWPPIDIYAGEKIDLCKKS